MYASPPVRGQWTIECDVCGHQKTTVWARNVEADKDLSVQNKMADKYMLLSGETTMVTKLDKDFVQAGLNGASTAADIISALAREVERLEGGMVEAVKVIKEAKAQFAPNTTNSTADDFLRMWGG